MKSPARHAVARRSATSTSGCQYPRPTRAGLLRRTSGSIEDGRPHEGAGGHADARLWRAPGRERQARPDGEDVVVEGRKAAPDEGRLAEQVDIARSSAMAQATTCCPSNALEFAATHRGQDHPGGASTPFYLSDWELRFGDDHPRFSQSLPGLHHLGPIRGLRRPATVRAATLQPITYRGTSTTAGRPSTRCARRCSCWRPGPGFEIGTGHRPGARRMVRSKSATSRSATAVTHSSGPQRSGVGSTRASTGGRGSGTQQARRLMADLIGVADSTGRRTRTPPTAIIRSNASEMARRSGR